MSPLVTPRAAERAPTPDQRSGRGRDLDRAYARQPASNRVRRMSIRRCRHRSGDTIEVVPRGWLPSRQRRSISARHDQAARLPGTPRRCGALQPHCSSRARPCLKVTVMVCPPDFGHSAVPPGDISRTVPPELVTATFATREANLATGNARKSIAATQDESALRCI